DAAVRAEWALSVLRRRPALDGRSDGADGATAADGPPRVSAGARQLSPRRRRPLAGTGAARSGGQAGAGPASPGHRRARESRICRAQGTAHGADAARHASTVLMIDMSRSMFLRGCFLAAKKVAIALDSLIRSQYPRDSLYVVGFSNYAVELKPQTLPQLALNDYVYGTNMQHGFQLARSL